MSNMSWYNYPFYRKQDQELFFDMQLLENYQTDSMSSRQKPLSYKYLTCMIPILRIHSAC